MHGKLTARKIILLIGDLTSFVIGLWLSLTVRHLSFPTVENMTEHLFSFWILFLIWMVINYINGLYDTTKDPKSLNFYRRIWEAAGISFLAGIVFFYIIPQTGITPKTILLLSVIFAYGTDTLWRSFVYNFIFPKTAIKNVLFVGYTKEVKELSNILTKTQHLFRPKALLSKKGHNIENLKTFSNLNDINNIIKKEDIDLVVLAPHIKGKNEAVEKLYNLLFEPTKIKDLTTFYEEITGRVPPSTFKESWFLDHLRNTQRQHIEWIRRFLDIIAGLVLGGLTLVLFPAIVIAIKLESSGPVLISQKRVGKDGEEFIMHKFRSMYAISEDGTAETEGPQFATKDDERITKVGSFLRKARLDELPQVWNLIKGELTLIGPRPERPEIVEKLKQRMPYYPLRHIIKPGLTSWAVLHQNYTDTLEKSLQKLQYDLYYIKNRSFLLDLSIGLRTINVVMRMMGQ